MQYLVSAVVKLKNRHTFTVGTFVDCETPEDAVAALKTLHMPDDADVCQVQITNTEIGDPYGIPHGSGASEQVKQELAELRKRVGKVLELIHKKAEGLPDTTPEPAADPVPLRSLQEEMKDPAPTPPASE